MVTENREKSFRWGVRRQLNNIIGIMNKKFPDTLGSVVVQVKPAIVTGFLANAEYLLVSKVELGDADGCITLTEIEVIK